MLEIAILNEQRKYYLSVEQKSLIERVLQALAAQEGIADSEVAVTLVDEDQIRALNRDYRGLDQATDVLSFAMNEGDEDDFVEIDEAVNLLGDIIISLPHVYAQAEEYGHTPERELAFLVVHGFLHLIGEDHETDEAADQMFAKQEALLTQLNITR